MAQDTISKSKFKPRVLEILREVEQSRKELIITDRGKPVLKIVPFTEKPSEILKTLRGTVTQYKDPTKPVDSSWNALS